MRIIRKKSQSGTNNKTLCIVTGLHGDEAFIFEPLKEFIEGLDTEGVDVKLLLANELAAQMDARYVDIDLNRAFGRKRSKENYEACVATEVMSCCKSDLLIDFHAHEHDERFAFVSEKYMSDEIRKLVEALGIPYCIIAKATATGSSTLVENVPNSMSIETGVHYSEEAVEYAKECVKGAVNFLRESKGKESKENNCTVFLAAERFIFNESKVEVETLPHIKNFSKIIEGEEIAAGLTAPHDLIPVLVSSKAEPGKKILLACTPYKG